MIVGAGDAQTAKRRRLNTVVNHGTEPATPSPLGKEGYNDGTVEPLNKVYVSESASRSARADSHRMFGLESTDCCYGMLCDIPVTLPCGLTSNSIRRPVGFRSPNHLFSVLDSGSTTFDIPCSIAARILGELESALRVKTQLYCHSKVKISPGGSNRQHGRQREKPLRLWFLNIIIFGPENLGETIGEHLSKDKMYLQDPLGCEVSVPYRNPHIVTLDSDETVMSDSFDLAFETLEIERLEAGPDLLAQLMEDEVPLPETDAPDIVRTALFRHQKQALTFMVRQEKGWDLDDGTRGIWSQKRDFLGRSRYTNNINGCSSDEAPLDFRGGLLADDMGLGKTLSMICLIATNQAHSANSLPCVAPATSNSASSLTMKATLLVVPPGLIQAWKEQIFLHLQPEELKTHVYHGQNRMGIDFLGQFDVVITSYHTVSAIWRKHLGQPGKEKSIFSLNWHRVVLDEAHTIQNPQSQITQACYALLSVRRWAITGTPIQNKLLDFASIIRFLQVLPYSNQETFKEEILRPWQNRHGTDAQGFLRLKTLVRAITISRTKAVVQLPPRVDEIHHLNFTPAEREKYEAAKTQSRALLEEAISSGNQGGKTFNALWLLNFLRLICNHGLLAQSTLEKNPPQNLQGSQGGWSSGEALDSLYGTILCSAASCSTCGANMLEDILEGSESSGIGTQLPRTPSELMTCEQCNSHISDDKISQSPWNNLDLPGSAESSAPVTPAVDSDVAFTIESMSTKIKALVADLYKHNTTEKSVVFSYWTNTLDLVQLMLNDRGITYTRIDGQTSLSKRSKALRAFQRDDSIRVILVSITCGGAGLDLTTASRAYLLEPHWNPMIEEQALCRVHRVGQKRAVTMIRYLMRDSFEEQIVDIQKRKKMLAQVTFGQSPMSEAGIGLGTLQYLKSVLE